MNVVFEAELWELVLRTGDAAEDIRRQTAGMARSGSRVLG